MSILNLANDIINGYRISDKDDLSIFSSCNLYDLTKGADLIRTHYNKNTVELCTILNAKSGKCSENCKYCAQSAHYNTFCEVYPFMDCDAIVAKAMDNYNEGVNHFALVTAGRALSGSDFEKCLNAFKAIHSKCPDLKLCASLGLLSKEQYSLLKNAGVTRIHNNIETAPSFFESVCTSHSQKDKFEAISNAKMAGLDVCSGGIIGMGESFNQRLEMALTLSKMHIMSIPINVLIPIKGTPFENLPRLSEDEILRTIASFKFINPEANIRLAGGRILLNNAGKEAFCSGASASITGNMLTTSGYTIKSDYQMLNSLDRKVI